MRVISLIACCGISLRYGPAMCAGIIGGTLALSIYHMGVFFMGALWGIVNALLLNHIILSQIGFTLCKCNDLLLGTMIVFAVVFGGLSVLWHDHPQDTPASHPRKLIIFLKTSFTGAYLLIRAAEHLMGTPFDELGLVKMQTPPEGQLQIIILIVVIAVGGSLLQMKCTHFEHCGCDDDDHIYDGAALEERRHMIVKAEGGREAIV